MATRTWNADAGTYSFLDESNPPWSSGVPAVSGDTIDLTTAYEPASDRPAAGTFSFSVAAALTLALQDWLAGASCGAVTVNYATANCWLPSPITSTLTATSGTVKTSGETSVAGLVTVGGTLEPQGGNLIANGGVTLAGGTITCTGAFTLDSASVIAVTGNAVIELGESGTTLIYGGINAGAYTITWSGGGTLIADQAGTLNLGATTGTTSLQVTISAATTLDANMNINTFTVNAELTASNKAVESSNSFTWDANAALVAGSALTVTILAQVFSFTSGGTVAGTLNLTVPSGNTVSGAWDSSAQRLSTLTVAGALTATGNIYFKGLVLGTSTITAGADLSIVGDGTTASTSSGGTIDPGAFTVTVSNVAASAANPIYAVGCVDGGGNGAGVIFTATATKKKSRRFGRLMGVRAA